MESASKNKNKEQNAQIIKEYVQWLKLEKSLSPNTVDAYQRDLRKLLDFLRVEGIDFLDVRLDDLQRFSAGLHDIGIHPRSQARILSGVKSFYHFLVLADHLEADPAELLEGPKIGLHLPEVLTVEEIDRIIDAVDMDKPEGQRNRAIIETLYSCGLRVSELCNLRLSDLYFDEQFIRVEGKGSKQRLVPISGRAIKEINYWLMDRSHGRIKPGNEDYIFLARWGNRISRIMVFHLAGQGVGRPRRHQQDHQPPHLPPLLRHPPAGRRSQPARHPRDVRSRVHRHHRNLHAHRPPNAAQRNYIASSEEYQVCGRTKERLKGVIYFRLKSVRE